MAGEDGLVDIKRAPVGAPPPVIGGLGQKFGDARFLRYPDPVFLLPLVHPGQRFAREEITRGDVQRRPESLARLLPGPPL
jgi:hypothetical protein